MSKIVTCQRCKGTGYIDKEKDIKCPICKGKGYIIIKD